MADATLSSKTDDSTLSREEFIQKIHFIFKKMGPRTLDIVLADIKDLKDAIDEHLSEFVSLTFEKAIDQTLPFTTLYYAEMFFQLFKNSSGLRKALISKCQHEFQNNVITDDEKLAEKLPPFLQQIENTEDPDDKVYRSFYEHEHKRRSVGIVQFIGELFKVGCLTSNIMFNCVDELLNHNLLECLCELLTIVGFHLEHESQGRSRTPKLNKCFQKLKDILTNEDQISKMSSRLKCLIQNVIDLRENKWVPRTQMKMEPIRPGPQRGDHRRTGYQKNTRKFKDLTTIALPESSQVAAAICENKFPTRARRNNKRDGNNNASNYSKPNSPKSQTGLLAKSNSPQKTILKDDQKTEKYSMLLELYRSSIETHQKSTHRTFVGEIVCKWINCNLISANENLCALKAIFATSVDSDKPKIWLDIAECITPLIKNNFLTIEEIDSLCPHENVMQEIHEHLIAYTKTK